VEAHVRDEGELRIVEGSDQRRGSLRRQSGVGRDVWDEGAYVGLRGNYVRVKGNYM
jgi:hypothetical protein